MNVESNGLYSNCCKTDRAEELMTGKRAGRWATLMKKRVWEKGLYFPKASVKRVNGSHINSVLWPWKIVFLYEYLFPEPSSRQGHQAARCGCQKIPQRQSPPGDQSKFISRGCEPVVLFMLLCWRDPVGRADTVDTDRLPPRIFACLARAC